ncbi:MAG: hypothetical protein J0L52_03510 [Caulobacterales bacterium]|nr:hypothetical protein [Caulobacterales bacterium]
MISSLVAALVLSLSGQGGASWVWSYYDGDGAVVLAREIPDTPNLSAVLECTPGSGVVHLTMYEPDARPDFVNVTVGEVSADVERVAGDGLSVRLGLDHPILHAFGQGHALTVSAGSQSASVAAPHPRLMSAFRSACR